MRNGFRIEIVLFQICLVLMPNSSRRGGSSSKLELPIGTVVLKEVVDWGAEPTSKDMKGIGLEVRGWNGAVGRC